MSNTDNKLHKMAIDSMVICTKKWHVQFYITFNKLGKTAITGNWKWKIKVMNQVFIDASFVECARKSVKLVMAAFENQEPLIKQQNMIPITQTKVVVRNSKDEIIVRGNCYAAVVASMLELPITEVPNIEVLFHMEGNYANIVMSDFIESMGYELLNTHKFRVFHDGKYGVEERERNQWISFCKDKYYLVTGTSPRGVKHIVIYKNGEMVHDPHPTREGITTLDYFEYIEKKSS